MVRRWTNDLRDQPVTALAPSLCIVVHHGPPPRSGPHRFHDLFPELDPGLREFVPDSRILVDDLTGFTDAALLARPLPTFARLVLWALRDGRLTTVRERLAFWAPELRQLLRQAPEDFKTLLRYILTTAGPATFAEVHDRIVTVIAESEHAMQTAADELIWVLHDTTPWGACEGRRCRRPQAPPGAP